MSRALGLLALCMVASVVLVGSAQAGTFVRITSLTVNPNRSVTVTWALDPDTDSFRTSNWELRLDGRTIRDWSSTTDRSTSWTSRPLASGRHTVVIESFTVAWSNKYYESLNCSVSQRDDYIYVCSFTDDATRTFSVGGGGSPAPVSTTGSSQCIVPDVVGLRLSDARARLRAAGCKAGAIRQAPSSRGGGTVLQQKPLRNKHFPQGATVDLVIARY